VLFSVGDWAALLPEYCVTHFGRVLVRYDCASTSTCSEHGWTALGKACRSDALINAVPDVFLLSCILFLGTFSVAYFLKTFRTSAYFPTKVRSQPLRKVIEHHGCCCGYVFTDVITSLCLFYFSLAFLDFRFAYCVFIIWHNKE